MWHSFRGWQGLGLIAISLVVTLWFAATGRLILFIHPRYVIFTVVMAVVGLAFVVAAIAQRVRERESGGHDHDHDHGDDLIPHAAVSRRSFWSAAAPALTGASAVVAALALLLLPAKTLSVGTAQQRAVNSTSIGAGSLDSASTTVSKLATASTSAFARFTVQDWSVLLRQGTDLGFYSGKPVDVTGFISANPSDPANSFYLSRFVITCCAVDAQPLGIPISLPHWKSQFVTGKWLTVTGNFGANPSRTSIDAIVLIPKTVDKVAEPDEPYLY